MLEIRPNCEHCNRVLAANSLAARICSFECTFCAQCVDSLLSNVCPNCGGGFVQRPIRPANNWKNNNSLKSHPASTVIKHRPVDLEIHQQFAAKIKSIPQDEI